MGDASTSTSTSTSAAATAPPPLAPRYRYIPKADLAKRKIEALFASLTNEREEALTRSKELEESLSKLDINDNEKTKLRKQHVQQEMAFLRDRRRPMSEQDFEMITIIGKGAFGEVILVKHKTNEQYYAMKKLRKADMLRKEQVNHAWSERHVLVAADHEFVCKLCFSFQSKDYLYLVMEYLPGGDLMTLLIEKDTLTEHDARFYIAEMIVAIDTIHRLGFIHRDIKPDNLLIDKSGHLKLSDFGLCKSFNVNDIDVLSPTNCTTGNNNSSNNSNNGAQSTLNELSMTERAAQWRQNARKQAFSTVGTPDYISCEILLKRGYNKECDYWSLGVVLYEMLVGYPPFYAEDALKTCRKILNWRETLRFPDEANLSWEAKDLIQSLICDPRYRLGSALGIDDFKDHPFFKHIDWNNLNEMKPPFIPQLSSATDTKYFEDHKPQQQLSNNHHSPSRTTSYLKTPGAEEFIGFTFKRYNANDPTPGRRAGLTSHLFSNPDDDEDDDAIGNGIPGVDGPPQE